MCVCRRRACKELLAATHYLQMVSEGSRACLGGGMVSPLLMSEPECERGCPPSTRDASEWTGRMGWAVVHAYSICAWILVWDLALTETKAKHFTDAEADTAVPSRASSAPVMPAVQPETAGQPIKCKAAVALAPKQRGEQYAMMRNAWNRYQKLGKTSQRTTGR